MGPFASPSASPGPAASGWGPPEGEARPAPSSLQDCGLGFLPQIKSSIDFSCTIAFLLLAAQSTSLKEAQEIFKSKQ